MGRGLRAISRKNLIAIVAGVFLAGAPLVAFDVWLGGLIERQGQEEVDTSAKRAISLAESRVGQAVAALDDLAARGVDSCRPDHLTLMRQADFVTAPIKEVGVIAGDGQTLCTDLGLPLGDRQVLSSEPLAGADGYTLDIVQFGDGERMVRLRRKVGAGPNGIAALMPVALFLPLVCLHRGRHGHRPPPGAEDIL
jgi:sensor c-di-GMP phosphodiesterase-like protein